MSTEYAINARQLEAAAEEVRRTKRPKSIDLGSDLVAVIKPAHHSHQPSVLRRGGEYSAMITPAARTRKGRPRRPKTEADMAAFRASFGSWKDIDTDKLIEDIYESRRISTRPPVEL